MYTIIAIVVVIGLVLFYVTQKQTTMTGGAAEISEAFQEFPTRTPQVPILERELDGLIQGGGAPIEDALKQPAVPAKKLRVIISNELISIKASTGEELALQNEKVKTSTNGSLNNELYKLRLVQNNPKKLDMLKIRFDKPTEINFTNPVSGKTRNIWAQDELTVQAPAVTEKDKKLSKTQSPAVVKKFTFVNKKDPLDNGPIAYDTELLIKTSKGFLVADVDKVKTTGSIANATTWTIQHQKGCGPLWRFKKSNK